MSDLRWPADFSFGVATAGFQIEGGYNGPDEPRNNWAEWESLGRVARSGRTTGFWDDFATHLDLASEMGLNSFRMSIEWSRVEPSPGVIDEAAITRYREILAACTQRGLRPLVTLHHFTHPEWLGASPWSDDEGWRRLASWYDFAVTRFGDLCQNWITSNELNILAVNSYLMGDFPPGRSMDVAATLQMIDRLLAAHVVGYQSIKAIQPESVVATNNFSFSLYELDRFILDLLHAHARQIDESELTSWLSERRLAHYEAVPGGRGAFRPIEKALRRLSARLVSLDSALPTARSQIRATRCERLLDVSQLDYYSPTAGEHLTPPGRRTAGGRQVRPGRPLWDDRPDPRMFLSYLIEAGQDGLPVWVVENGMCTRRDDRVSWSRLDGWTRERYLRENLGALLAARRLGVDVTGYWHWTLVDNYEWGSCEPRFGLFDLRPDGSLGPGDAAGHDASTVMAEIVSGLRANDWSVVSEPIRSR